MEIGPETIYAAHRISTQKIDSYEHKCNTTADQLENAKLSFRVMAGCGLFLD